MKMFLSALVSLCGACLLAGCGGGSASTVQSLASDHVTNDYLGYTVRRDAPGCLWW